MATITKPLGETPLVSAAESSDSVIIIRAGKAKRLPADKLPKGLSGVIGDPDAPTSPPEDTTAISFYVGRSGTLYCWDPANNNYIAIVS